jgi:hypothetical protein
MQDKQHEKNRNSMSGSSKDEEKKERQNQPFRQDARDGEDSHKRDSDSESKE